MTDASQVKEQTWTAGRYLQCRYQLAQVFHFDGARLRQRIPRHGRDHQRSVLEAFLSMLCRHDNRFQALGLRRAVLRGSFLSVGDRPSRRDQEGLERTMRGTRR